MDPARVRDQEESFDKARELDVGKGTIKKKGLLKWPGNE